MSFNLPFIGGNWKMNHGPTEARAFVDTFSKLYEPADDRTVVFFPPAISITEFSRAAARRPDLRLGVQDVFWEKNGAYTGSISAPIAADAGAEFALAGHSERRHIFGDSDEDVARKVEAIATAGLVPVLCIGGLLDQRERGEMEQVVRRQLEVGLSGLSAEMVLGTVIAYEPVWAIGTGLTATPEDASAVHQLIRQLLIDLSGGDRGREIPIIYGGSVKPGNIMNLLAAPEIDGALVGGASLKPDDFAAICQAEH